MTSSTWERLDLPISLDQFFKHFSFSFRLFLHFNGKENEINKKRTQRSVIRLKTEYFHNYFGVPHNLILVERYNHHKYEGNLYKKLNST